MKAKAKAKEEGFSLVEALVVVSIFTFLFAAILTMLTTSNRSWRIGYNKLVEQQEARKAMDEITRFLRRSNPEWIDESGNPYPVSIPSGNRIDFYVPSFTSEGEISAFRKITFKLKPEDPHQLLKKEGTAASVVVATNIENLNFGGGCAGCSAFNCSTVANDCPQVKITVQTKREPEIEYTLNSQVTLRNINIVIPDGVEIEQPEEGEF